MAAAFDTLGTGEKHFGMFKISTRQMDSLALGMGRRFEQRLVSYVSEAFPDQAEQLAAKAQAEGESAGVLRFVGAGIDRAEAMNIVSDADIACFIALILANLRLGLDKAEVLGWTKAMLDRSDVPGGLKIDWIVSRLTDFAADDAAAAAVLRWLSDARQRFTA